MTGANTVSCTNWVTAVTTTGVSVTDVTVTAVTVTPVVVTAVIFLQLGLTLNILNSMDQQMLPWISNCCYLSKTENKNKK